MKEEGSAEENSTTKKGGLWAEFCLSEPSFWPLPGGAEERETDNVDATGLTDRYMYEDKDGKMSEQQFPSSESTYVARNETKIEQSRFWKALR